MITVWLWQGLRKAAGAVDAQIREEGRVGGYIHLFTAPPPLPETGER